MFRFQNLGTRLPDTRNLTPISSINMLATPQAIFSERSLGKSIGPYCFFAEALIAFNFSWIVSIGCVGNRMLKRGLGFQISQRVMAGKKFASPDEYRTDKRARKALSKSWIISRTVCES